MQKLFQIGFCVFAALVWVAFPLSSFAKSYAYITGCHEVWILDTSDNSVVGEIGLAGCNLNAIALNPRNQNAYVVATDSHAVVVIDTFTNRWLGTVRVGVGSREVAFTPDGSRAYVTTRFDVSVIDTARLQVVATVPGLDDANGVAVSPDGRQVYVANEGGKNIVVIDTSTNTVVDRIDLGAVRPSRIGISSNGRIAIVLSSSDRKYLLIDLASKREIEEREFERWQRPTDLVVQGNRSYVVLVNGSSARPPDMLRRDLADRGGAYGYTGLVWPVDVAVTPDGARVYVTDLESEFISILDPKLDILKLFKMPDGPHFAIAITPER